MQSESLFSLPDTVSISADALELAERLLETAQGQFPRGDHIVVFDWAFSRRVRNRGDVNSWRELGAGPGMSVYERSEVPHSVIATSNALSFAIKIPESIMKDYPRRQIDIDKTMPDYLTLS